MGRQSYVPALQMEMCQGGLMGLWKEAKLELNQSSVGSEWEV